ncbi:MAG: flagellar biosynthesis anti-sigma factor FlgM [Firmicutes bacterium]|nr:flagellar biosynthesis anti-sigma factor FlgM [Bacillota bacterium]
MRIDPLGPPGVPPDRPSGASAPRGAPTPPAEDRVELSSSDPHRNVDERKLRLEALREAILQGRYHVTEDALARAILRAAGSRHDRRV